MNPAAGIIEADHTIEIAIRHEEFQTLEEFIDGVPQNFYCEDARDKEVMLVIKVCGSCTTEAKFHRIRVRYSITGKRMPMNRKANNPLPSQTNLLRSDFQINSACDVVDQLRHLHSP